MENSMHHFPLTRDKKRNLIISPNVVTSLLDSERGKCVISYVENGLLQWAESDLTAEELYEEICSPSKP